MFKHMMDSFIKQKGFLKHVIPMSRNIKVIGEAGGGLVKATMLGSGKLEKLEIDEKLKDSEITVIEDLILHACNVAREKIIEEHKKLAQQELEKAEFIPDIKELFEDPSVRDVFKTILNPQTGPQTETENKTPSNKKKGNDDEEE